MVVPNADYTFYKEAYGGSVIAEDEWEGYASKAAAYLSRLGSLSVVTPYGDDEDQAWSMAACAVAEEYHNFDVAANGGAGMAGGPVSSASVGSVSVSYDSTFGGSIDLSPAGRERALRDAASQYLHVYLGIC